MINLDIIGVIDDATFFVHKYGRRAYPIELLYRYRVSINMLTTQYIRLYSNGGCIRSGTELEIYKFSLE